MKIRFVGAKKQDIAIIRQRLLQANRTRNYRNRQKARKDTATINHQAELLSDAIELVAGNGLSGLENNSLPDTGGFEDVTQYSTLRSLKKLIFYPTPGSLKKITFLPVTVLLSLVRKLMILLLILSSRIPITRRNPSASTRLRGAKIRDNPKVHKSMSRSEQI
ncbi:hypothetical protein EDB80DRAFT_720972 [Ilyonectria destructans]|nr:hypothetical protein EDB80DRAFT_720972 [Ilyonectria destructans]